MRSHTLREKDRFDTLRTVKNASAGFLLFIRLIREQQPFLFTIMEQNKETYRFCSHCTTLKQVNSNNRMKVPGEKMEVKVAGLLRLIPYFPYEFKMDKKSSYTVIVIIQH